MEHRRGQPDFSHLHDEKLSLHKELVRVVPFDEQPPEDREYYLDQRVDSRAYGGQDSVVYRENETGQALHVYFQTKLPKLVEYANSVNQSAAYLKELPFVEELSFRGDTYTLTVRINPIIEVGERQFIADTWQDVKAYSSSQFIEGMSLTWVQQATDDAQREIARHCTILFYDRLNEHLARANVRNIDVNPVNIKYDVNETDKTVTLIVTDLAKNIGDVAMAQPSE